MFRPSVAITCLVLTVGTADCVPKSLPKLSAVEAQECRRSGGYESRAPFGGPFCQADYPDGGKTCSGKTDCLGRCLSNPPEGNIFAVPIGTPAVGHCEAQKETFGCHANVEGGKLAETYWCSD
jgi:hypothetical protein